MSKIEVIEIEWFDIIKIKPKHHCKLVIQCKNGSILIGDFLYAVINESSYLKFKYTEVPIEDIAYWGYLNIQGVK